MHGHPRLGERSIQESWDLAIGRNQRSLVEFVVCVTPRCLGGKPEEWCGVTRVLLTLPQVTDACQK
ncbi:hypothetical protein [Streptomyces sp. NPDC097640]|uniref:hypothetical protein n=1 Tax=Streptomyces sp. NPDC097640 TaxID=3157229 RepID=UPI00332FBB97